MKKLSDRVQAIVPSPTLRLDAIAKQMAREGIDVINLSVGEPDIATPAEAAEEAIRAINSGFTKYTDAGGIEELRRDVSTRAKEFLNLLYEPDQVVISNGGKHSLYNIFCTLLDAGDEVIIPAPYWVSYPEQVKLAGGVPVICHTDETTGFKVTVNMLEQQLSPRTKALILNSPSNPTGAIYTRTELEALAQFAVVNDLYVVSDEIYDQLVFRPAEHISIAQLSDEIRDRTIIVNGWSKSYGMTGWRLGYTLSNTALAKAFRNFQGHVTSNVCSIAQRAAIGALWANQRGLLHRFQTRKDMLVSALQGIEGVRLFPPDGAFYVFPNLGSFIGRKYKGNIIDSIDTFCALLLADYKVSIVPGSGFGSPCNARISYAVEQNRLGEAIGRFRNFADQMAD